MALKTYNPPIREKDLSALKKKTRETTWFSSSLKDRGREKSAWAKKKKGAQKNRSRLIQVKGPHFTLRLVEPQKRRRAYSWTIGIPRRIIPLATRRNRWKRRIKEALRRCELKTSSYQIGVSLHNGSGSPSFAEIKKEITELLFKLGVMK